MRALTGGRGADYVLEAAGMTAAQEQALTTARRAGTIVLTGVERLGATITYPQFELALQGRRVLSCQNGNVRMRRDLPLFVGMLEDGRLDAEPIITSRYALDDINEALAASAEKRDLTGVIVPNGSVLTAMHTFPRPEQTHLSVEREPVDGACPACGAQALASYRVLGEGGLWDVVKCQECLTSVSRERAPRLGSLTPLGLTIG